MCGVTNRTHCHGNKNGIGMNALCHNLKDAASCNFVFSAFFRIVWTMMADLPDFQEQEAAQILLLVRADGFVTAMKSEDFSSTLYWTKMRLSAIAS